MYFLDVVILQEQQPKQQPPQQEQPQQQEQQPKQQEQPQQPEQVLEMDSFAELFAQFQEDDYVLYCLWLIDYDTFNNWINSFFKIILIFYFQPKDTGT